MALCGAIVGVMTVSVIWARLSDECRAMRRSLSLLPPGLRCYGSKDELVMPWGANGPAVVPIWLAAAVAGALMTRVLVRRVMS